jgi:hypothetical protein
MINLLSKSTEKIQHDNTAAISFLNLEEEPKLRVINDSSLEFSSLEEYRKKDNTKNLSFEKPSAIYS